MSTPATDWKAVNAQRLATVHPTLRTRVEALISQMERIYSVPILVVYGLRTWDEQNILWQKGRSTAGPRVTNARGGWSMHNFGLAVDLVPDDVDVAGLQPNWNKTSHPEWINLLAEGLHFGLAEGAMFKSIVDLPHFYPKELPATPDDHMRMLYHQGGLPKVWEWFDTVVKAAQL